MPKLLVTIFVVFVMHSSTCFSQVLETEESNPLAPGQFEIGTGIEFQTSKEGTETALPIAIEYGLTRRFSILVEPVGFTNIHNKRSNSATGFGDLEVTLFYQLTTEGKIMPAISISAEVKLPTTKNSLIGTGKTDYTPFLIATKTTGRFFTSANLSYTILGKPKGVSVTNLFNYAVGTIYTASERNILFAELYGNTSAFGTDVPETTNVIQAPAMTTEISGGEVVGSIGFGRYIKKDLLLSMGVSYDNNKAILFRPGIEWSFGRKNSRIRIH
ncbi:MAG: transporter [Ginsengibacter sp.]